MKELTTQYFKNLQDQICLALEKADSTGKFQEDLWDRAEGGGGRSRIITNGSIIEKGGVNFSAVFGKTPEKILKALKLEEADFFATGVSIVIHPKSPMVPIIHMNVRFFEMSNGIRPQSVFNKLIFSNGIFSRGFALLRVLSPLGA